MTAEFSRSTGVAPNRHLGLICGAAEAKARTETAQIAAGRHDSRKPP